MMSIRLVMKNDAFQKMRDKTKVKNLIDDTLKLIGDEFIKIIRMNAAGAFKHTSGGYLAAVKKEQKQGRLKIWVDHPAAFAIEFGFDEERPMTWLAVDHAISFKPEGGGKITRRVTLEQIGKPSAFSQSGKAWTYPVKEGKFIITKSIEQVMPFIQQRLQKIFKVIVET